MNLIDPALNDAFDGGVDPTHFAVAEQVYACMETGNLGQAATLMEQYAKEHPEQADTLRLSLVRDYGTGL